MAKRPKAKVEKISVQVLDNGFTLFISKDNDMPEHKVYLKKDGDFVEGMESELIADIKSALGIS